MDIHSVDENDVNIAPILHESSENKRGKTVTDAEPVRGPLTPELCERKYIMSEDIVVEIVEIDLQIENAIISLGSEKIIRPDFELSELNDLHRVG